MRTLRLTFMMAIAVAAIALGYPITTAIIHGLNPATWPPVVLAPQQWFAGFINSYGWSNVVALVTMVEGQNPAFASGGLTQAGAICAVVLAFVVLLPSPKPGPRRDTTGLHGDARWAAKAERTRMNRGLEFGTDAETGKPVRVKVEGNLLTISPPRRGKTSGLIIPNLCAADRRAWCGPAVVIDPKAEVFRAVADRRQALGFNVRCLDPMKLCGGIDRWNPLAAMDPNNVTYLQRVARALLPPAVTEENAYFQNRAVDAITAAFLAAHKNGNATPLAVSDLLSSPKRLGQALEKIEDPTANRVRELIVMDSKTRDPILSTAQQSFQWCDDRRLQELTSTNTFSLVDLCRGDTDLFICVPTEDLETLAPFFRWLLTDLFATIRRNQMTERLVVFVDEARTFRSRGRGMAAGGLPGHGASLWSFWQDRSQLISVYGEHDAATLLRTSEFVTVSDPAMIDPQERELWSQALSEFTVLEETQVSDKTPQGQRTSNSQSPRAARLMTAEELGRLPATELLLFPNSNRYAKRPVRLRKTRYDDQRFAELTTPVPPVGPTT